MSLTKYKAFAVTVALALSAVSSGVEAKGGLKTFHTYTKTHSTGKVYIGRTSGIGKPAKVLQKRDRSHHMNNQGYGPARLDKSSANKAAIRGREQQLIEKYKSEGRSGNAINGISDRNKKKAHYISEADREFGKP